MPGRPAGCWLAWIIAGLMTVTAALSYGELAAMMPKAGGQYVYLREAYSPLWGFLYGWTLFLVIQTGTIAAVAVGFARFLGVVWPAISPTTYVVSPIRLSDSYAISLSVQQLVALLLIVFLTALNTQRPQTRQADSECVHFGEIAGPRGADPRGNFSRAELLTRFSSISAGSGRCTTRRRSSRAPIG